MRPAKLYLEIFISFVLAIIVSEAMIFFLFTDSERRIVGYKLAQNTRIKVEMLKMMVDEQISLRQNPNPWKTKEIKDLLASVGNTYDAWIWISNADGVPLVISPGGNIPKDIDLLYINGDLDPSTGVKLYNNIKNTGQVYTSISLSPLHNETPILYIAFNISVMGPHRWQFLIGLFVIGSVVAILIFPVSKFITDRIKLLRISALRIADGELSHRVSVKARDEIGELGIAFNQMAERLERMIVGGKELTANISHELRTPLTRIRIAQELLSERLGKGNFENWEGRLDEIKEDIEELDTLIGRILELSKLDMHELGLKHESFNPTNLLEALLEKLGPVITYKKLAVQKKLPNNLLMTGDPTALEMAFSNILDNAVKFSPEAGSLRIELSQNGDFQSVLIANSYEKLPEQDLEKIFEPFHRLKNSNASGTGLGLSIAAKIIQKHGGVIKAFNAPDGFEINVKLPMPKARREQI